MTLRMTSVVTRARLKPTCIKLTFPCGRRYISASTMVVNPIEFLQNPCPRGGFVVFRKTRIAPTPSGFLHLGNVLSFALTAGLARRSGASILLRIDDLDRERVSREYVEDIFDALNFLGIPWDEGPRNW